MSKPKHIVIEERNIPIDEFKFSYIGFDAEKQREIITGFTSTESVPVGSVILIGILRYKIISKDYDWSVLRNTMVATYRVNLLSNQEKS